MVKVYYSYEFAQTVSQPISKQSNFLILPKSNFYFYKKRKNNNRCCKSIHRNYCFENRRTYQIYF